MEHEITLDLTEMLLTRQTLRGRIDEITARLTKNPRTPTHRALGNERDSLTNVCDKLTDRINVHFDAVRAKLGRPA